MTKSDRSTATLSYKEEIGCDVWRGTSEQLTNAGLVELHMLPGQQGRNKRCVTICGSKQQDEKSGVFFFQIRKISNDRFEVLKGVMDEERDRRRANWRSKYREEDARREREREHLRKLEGIKVWFDLLPNNVTEFREKVSGLIPSQESELWFEGGFGNWHGRGYHFDEKSTNKIFRLFGEIQEIISTGRVVYDSDQRSQAIDKIYAEKGLKAPKQEPRLRLVKHESSGKTFGQIINEVKSASLD